MPLDARIEATLFFIGEPITVGGLAKLLKTKEHEVETALVALSERLSGRGVALVRHEGTVALRTAPKAAGLIEEIRREELAKDIGRAGAETLAIILYRGPVTRAQIDYIRGVNSTFILRNLLIRGLVERVENPADARSFIYRPTLDLLSFLGVRSLEELPDYAHARAELDAFEREFAASQEEQTHGETA